MSRKGSIILTIEAISTLYWVELLNPANPYSKEKACAAWQNHIMRQSSCKTEHLEATFMSLNIYWLSVPVWECHCNQKGTCGECLRSEKVRQEKQNLYSPLHIAVVVFNLLIRCCCNSMFRVCSVLFSLSSAAFIFSWSSNLKQKEIYHEWIILYETINNIKWNILGEVI